ncbi:MAG TPA: ribosomal L7Ae/L30e/S12e/Gadd45 family protein [Gemmatimonadales bacterium]|nr:ribosomal L7Ae/L30e/S12e/Gadd45 family protein [Gemmatimonadales bacterium]
MSPAPGTGGILGLLGLGYRGRLVVVGVDAVRAEVQAGRARCVVLAADASPRAIEKVMRLAKAKGVPLVAGPPAAAIGEQFGKPPVMAVGVRDRGLADGIVRSAPAVRDVQDRRSR